jgi:hypothetical protein
MMGVQGRRFVRLLVNGTVRRNGRHFLEAFRTMPRLAVSRSSAPERSRSGEPVKVQEPFDGDLLDKSRARHRPGGAPETDLEAQIERAWT